MKKFINKITILIILYIVGITGLLLINFKINFNNILDTLQELAISYEKKRAIECLQEIKIFYQALQKKGISKNKIKSILMAYIKNKNKSEFERYIFVYQILNPNDRYFAKMLINPNIKSLECKLLDVNYKDIKGYAFRKDIIKIIKTSKEGFVSYYYKEPITHKIVKKITYVLYLPKLKWLLGTGVYMTKINKISKKYKTYIFKHISLYIILILMLIVALIILYLHRKFLKQMQKEVEKEKQILTLIPLMDEEITSFKFDSKYLYEIFSLININSFAVYKNNQKIFGDASYDKNNVIKYKEYCFVFKDINKKYLSILNHIASIFYLAFKKKEYEEKLEEKIALQIEEIKRKDRELLFKEKLAALGEVVGNIAHQWKQPLNAISNTVNNILLDIKLNNFNLEELMRHLNDIQKLTKNLSQIIDVFKNLYKNEDKKEIIHLKTVFDNVFLVFNHSDIKIIKNIQDCSFVGYANELEQVILAILNNAKDEFKRKNIKGTIEINANCQDENIVISIKDNAGGVPKDIKDKIFDYAFSTKNSSGLGLAFSRKIIEKNFNGKIILNNSDRGAEFLITFPLD